MKKCLAKKLAKITTIDQQQHLRPVDDDDQKRCHNCGTELIVLSRQTRSADEGMTIFYRCVKCPRTFKIG